MSFVWKCGPRIQKFAINPMRDDKKLNIMVGSVRSGKTWGCHYKILQGCAYDVQGRRIITGQTKETVYNNVLNDLFEMLDAEDYSYNRTTGRLDLYGVPWRVIGARDEGSEKLLRGSTVGLAVCDEVVLMPQGFFKMLLTRMSPPGSRLYGTTNPDSPLHWLKVDFLDNSALRDLLWWDTFTMDDNPNLSKEFVDSQKLFYKGMFYKRFIQGLWVMAEGAIWGDAWNDDLIYDTPPASLKNAGGFVDHWISCDYGTAHPHVYQEFWDDGNVIWLDREFVWDSRIEMRQKTDGQYADDLIAFMGSNSGCQVIVPPEALSFRQECMNRGIWITEANNTVADGLQTVAGLMSTKRLRINRACKRILRGIQSHVWDPQKAARGVEEPLKQDDDEADCLRYGLHTKIPKWRYMP